MIGAETMSRIWTGRIARTCVLFGDGAGAVVLRAGEGTGANADRGVLDTKIYSDGRHHDMLYVDGGVRRRRQGRAFAHARPRGVPTRGHQYRRGDRALGARSRHVASTMSIGSCRTRPTSAFSTARRERLGIRPERVISTIAEHGNTSAASVPLALERRSRDGRIKRGDLVLMEAMGGGLDLGRGAAALVAMPARAACPYPFDN